MDLDFEYYNTQFYTMKSICFLFTLLLLVSGCVVRKPDAQNISDPDYNKRVNVEGARYYHKLSPVGVSSIAATTIAGGYYGYQSDLIHYYQGTERKVYREGGAAIGAITGFTISYLINKALGWGKTTPANDANAWVKKANKQYVVISSQSNNYKLIHSSIEPSFTVKNVADAADFTKAFPYSSYADKAMSTGIENVTRNELPQLIDIFPKSKLVYNAKVKYIQTSPTFEELEIAADKKYPGLGLDLENYYLQLVKNINHANSFLSKYQNTVLKKEAVINAFSTEEKDVSILRNFKTRTGIFFNLQSDDMHKVSQKNKRNYLNALVSIEGLKADKNRGYDVVLDFYSKYKYITYPERKFDILSHTWDLYYDFYSKGNDLIGMVYNIVGNNQEGIDKKDVNEIIDSKLAVEATKIVVEKQDLVSNKDRSWEEWKKFKTWDSPFVTQSGEVKFIEYGYVINKSKFDLPVQVDFSLPLYRITETAFLGLTLGSSREHAGTKQQSYYLPLVRSNSKVPFAVLYDFGYGDQGGLKLLWGRVSSELKPGSSDCTIKYNRYSIPKQQLKSQEEWLTLAMHGFKEKISVNDIMNLFGGLKYDPTTYENAWGSERKRIQKYNCAVRLWHDALEYEEKKEFENAIRSLNQALECSSSLDAPIYGYIANLYFQLNDLYAAERNAQSAINIKGDALAYHVLGRVKYLNKDYISAIDILTKAIEMKEDAINLYFRAAAYSQFKEMKENAKKDLERARQICSDDNKLRYYIEEALYRQKYDLDIYERISFGLDENFNPLNE